MMNLIIALCLSASTSTYQTCDTGCVMHINSSKKITVSDLPHYLPSGEGIAYDVQLCGMVLKFRKKKFTINIFKPEIARSYTDYSDSTFTKEIGNNSISYYRQKRKNIAQWFGVIAPKNCDSKWFVFLDGKEMPDFEEIISEVSFSKD